jgi:phenylacetic acid degradation operon negative regulatory protein
VANASVLLARELEPAVGLRSLLSAWDLEALRAEYESFIAEHEVLLNQVRSGTIGAAEALVARTSVMDGYRRFPALDPDLPDGLMPRDWPRARTHQLFVEIYDALGALAEVRARQVVGEYSPELASQVHQHTVAEMLKG